MKIKKWLAIPTLLLMSLAASAYAYLQHPKFGALPDAANLTQSPNYRDGQFQNRQPNPEPVVDEASQKGWTDLLFSADEGRTPPAPIPARSIDLRALDVEEDVIVWLGHSSWYLQLSGKRILIDPVLSANASPVPYTNQAFEGTSVVSPEGLPEIDVLLISHDHWDHLDYPTIRALKGRIHKVIVGLGVGEHFRDWGFAESVIHEADWETAVEVDEDLSIHVLPARHYSGRWFERNQSLWASFALVTPDHKVFYSGDSGYGDHFKTIGNAFGGFDVALLDSGQYDEQWRHVHMMPEDAAQAADDLRTRTLIPAHVGKFSIAFHSWDEPFIRLQQASAGRNWELATPRIGQRVDLENIGLASSLWWQELQAADR